jgi:hypothetical protein
MIAEEVEFLKAFNKRETVVSIEAAASVEQVA